MFRQALVAIGMGLKQYVRTPLFVVLLILLPPAFITLAFLVTPNVPLTLEVPEHGATIAMTVNMPTLHGAIMVPMTVSFLSGMVGLFVMLDGREADRRLVIAGYPPLLLLGVRLVLIAFMVTLVTLISLAVTSLDFVAPQLAVFSLINLISGLQYAFIGAIIGTFLSAMSGTYIMFFAPMIDVGLVQNPMFTRTTVEWWVKLLPGYLPMNALTDSSFSRGFDTWFALGGSLLYVAVLGIIAAVLFAQVSTPGDGTLHQRVNQPA